MDVFYISLTGIGVVFSFLFIIFLLLKGLKIFAVEDKSKETAKKTKQNADKSIKTTEGVSPEEIAVITAVLNKNNLLTAKNIVIHKK